MLKFDCEVAITVKNLKKYLFLFLNQAQSNFFAPVSIWLNFIVYGFMLLKIYKITITYLWAIDSTGIWRSWLNQWFWASTRARSINIFESAVSPENAQAKWLSISTIFSIVLKRRWRVYTVIKKYHAQANTLGYYWLLLNYVLKLYQNPQKD